MARPRSGSVVEYERKDGSIKFSLRVTDDNGRWRVPLGTDEDGWHRDRADRKLAKTLVQIEAGVWEPPQDAVNESATKKDGSEAAPTEDITFRVFATECLAARKGAIAPNTYNDYEWRLCCHLLPFFGDYLVSQIDKELVDKYIAHKLAEREHIKAMIDSDTPLRDERGQRIKPLKNESINKTLAYLAVLLDIAIDRGKRTADNAARGKHRRLSAKRPRRPFLEPDEVQSLLAAAEELDQEAASPSERAKFVKRLRDEDGLSYVAIERWYRIPRSSAHYLYRRASEERVVIPVFRTIIAVLVMAGLRVSELCALTWRDVNFEKRRLNIRDAKTESGIREVRMSRWVAALLRTYRDSLESWELDCLVFPTSQGKRRDRKNVCDRIVKRAARLADKRRMQRDLSPLPAGITPHALRVTFITLSFEAGYPLPYVMGQVGHADESTTLQIYARWLQRKSREVEDAAFDDLVVGAAA